MKNIFFKNKTGGFTLVEMLVSLAIFSVVALVALGAFMKIIDANKKSHTLKTAYTNLNFVLEAMTRELRVGTNYHCSNSAIVVPTTDPYELAPASCSFSSTNGSDQWYIAFNSSKVYDDNNGMICNLIYAYHFDGVGLNKAEQGICGEALSFSPVIANLGPDDKQDVVINFSRASIKVVTEAGGGRQPYAQFHFVGSAGAVERVKTTFDIQTTVSQRLRQP